MTVEKNIKELQRALGKLDNEVQTSPSDFDLTNHKRGNQGKLHNWTTAGTGIIVICFSFACGIVILSSAGILSLSIYKIYTSSSSQELGIFIGTIYSHATAAVSGGAAFVLMWINKK